MNKVLAATAATLALSGCATIFNGSSKTVTVTSVPEGATASITNRAGEKVQSGVTPLTLSLKRGAGYFKMEDYTVTLKKEGFAPLELKLSGSVSGWYFGNLLLGGVLGMVIVDPLTGAMYTFPDSVSGTLESAVAPTSRADGSLTIVSTDAFTAEQLKKARLVSPPTVSKTR